MKRALLSALFFALFAAHAHAQTQQTDRDFDWLKGKVKTVTVEEARYDLVAGESLEKGRVLSRSVTYDADGNWTQWKDYDDKGRLMRSLVFSFIGTDRVALMENIERPPDALVTLGPARPARRADPRYSYKFKYVYGADGKRLGQTWYMNDGRLYMRQVYALKGARKVLSIYDERGRLDDRYEYKLDERGNETEMLLRDAVSDRIGYKYVEFDAQGNWTKRIVTRGFREFDSSQFERIKPWSVEYRTITYH